MQCMPAAAAEVMDGISLPSEWPLGINAGDGNCNGLAGLIRGGEGEGQVGRLACCLSCPILMPGRWLLKACEAVYAHQRQQSPWHPVAAMDMVVGYSLTMVLCRLHRKGPQGQSRAKNDTTDSLAYHAACPMQDTDLPMDLIQMRGPPSVKASLCCAPHPCASGQSEPGMSWQACERSRNIRASIVLCVVLCLLGPPHSPPRVGRSVQV